MLMRFLALAAALCSGCGGAMAPDTETETPCAPATTADGITRCVPVIGVASVDGVGIYQADSAGKLLVADRAGYRSVMLPLAAERRGPFRVAYLSLLPGCAAMQWEPRSCLPAYAVGAEVDSWMFPIYDPSRPRTLEAQW